MNDARCCCHGPGVVLVRGSDSSSSIWCRFMSVVSGVVDLLQVGGALQFMVDGGRSVVAAMTARGAEIME
ncbi:hypothetical protein DEO72_LG7g949 [Vigna unguiculata]|uniref:Uncharacterized protein n=1 Tax=Vigna unguiculata TaxID=3917 RepID=A0A4D6ME80_VIGUN|nr:hypothetical protein DEO72_LG7g949 [Vigna unguiculata]